MGVADQFILPRSRKLKLALEACFGLESSFAPPVCRSSPSPRPVSTQKSCSFGCLIQRNVQPVKTPSCCGRRKSRRDVFLCRARTAGILLYTLKMTIVMIYAAAAFVLGQAWQGQMDAQVWASVGRHTCGELTIKRPDASAKEHQKEPSSNFQGAKFKWPARVVCPPGSACSKIFHAMSGLAPLLAAAPAGSRFGPHFGDLLNQLRHAGPKRLMVITDFDQTSPGKRERERCFKTTLWNHGINQFNDCFEFKDRG